MVRPQSTHPPPPAYSPKNKNYLSKTLHKLTIHPKNNMNYLFN